MPDALHTTVETLLVLLLIVFVAVGFLGSRPGFLHASLTPNLILLVFLPVLLFEGAYQTEHKQLEAQLRQLEHGQQDEE